MTLPFRILGRKNSTDPPTTNAANNNTASSSAARFSYPGNRGGGNAAAPVTARGGDNIYDSSTSPSNSFTRLPVPQHTTRPQQQPYQPMATTEGNTVISTRSAPPNINSTPVLRGTSVDPTTQQQQQQHPNVSSSQSVLQPHSASNPLQQQQSSLPGGNGPGAANVSLSGTHSTTSSEEHRRPGAYQVTHSQNGPAQVYRVTVPTGVRPGSEFTVHAGPRRVRVRCPPTSRPGQSLQITLPPERITNYQQLRAAPLTSANGPGSGGQVTMSAEVVKVNEKARESGGSAQTYLVTIPPNIYPGMQFTVNVEGQKFMVSCPASAGPNMRVRIVPPVVREEPEAAPKTQVFEVTVPAGVEPGQPFALVANFQRVLVTCPPNVVPGQKIRFQLPVAQVVGHIKLDYESEKAGWKRTIRVTDLKFQWVKIDCKTEKKGDDAAADDSESGENVDTETTFDFTKSAYVRKLTYLEGNDARLRTGTLEVVPASEAVVDSRLLVHNRTLLSYADISQMQGKSLAEKQTWFGNTCQQLTTAWEEGHVKICVRRQHLLTDSVDAIMGLGRDDLRKRWRIEFLGEPAIDAGGPTKEWFELVSEQIYDPACGLWVPSVNNQACVDMNPASEMSCPDDHLIYFRFLGRVIGRALFDCQLIKGHMVRSLYKQLLGWPITFEDVKAQDEEYHTSLKKLTKLEDVSVMCLDFTVTEDIMGMRVEKELVEGGSMKEVTQDNISEYLESNIQYRMFNRNKAQLTELLLGFYDIIPEPTLTVFDANELELMLCGLPEIDLDDWQQNTNYKGLFEVSGSCHETVKWFWEVVAEYDTETKARLLQFSTGTSGVPLRGFAFLQGIDGMIKKFTIQGVDPNMYMYPRSHTCFNRIDLPLYSSKQELYDRLKIAVTTSYVGFDTE